MSNCPTCKESILSQTPSLIGKTLCNPDCPQDITCEDIIPSNCVFYSGATLSCPSGNTSVPYGVTITEALNTMYQLICQNSTSNTVQITANDTCYGYLASKITSSSLLITVLNPGACEKLNIEEKCRNWISIGPSSTSGTNNFRNTWKNYTTDPYAQPVEVSTIKECSVKLRGRATNTIHTSECKSYLIMVLATAPAKNRVFSVNVLKLGASCPVVEPKLIIVDKLGNVTLSGGILSGEYVVSFDGIEFECACEPNC